MNQKVRASRSPNLEGLTPAQLDHVMCVYPEIRGSMADFLRQGAIEGPWATAERRYTTAG